jgi:hypothetical protein
VGLQQRKNIGRRWVRILNGDLHYLLGFLNTAAPPLELFPSARGIVVTAAEGVRVDFSGYSDRGVPQALRYCWEIYAVRQQVATVTVTQRV